MTTESPPAAPPLLSDVETDALTEIANIGVSRAAASLRAMVGHHVALSVPSVAVVAYRTAVDLIGQRESDQLVAVRQAFCGALDGRALLLIFPQTNSLELTRAVLGVDASSEQVAAMEDEALTETGNIILNGCVGTVANMLSQTLKMSLPEVVRGTGDDVFASASAEDNREYVLFFFINFVVQERNIRGYIALLMDVPSLAALKMLLEKFIADVMDEIPAPPL